MILQTLRFGDIEVDQNKKVIFTDGLPGFENLSMFFVLVLEDTSPIYWLQSMEDPAITLPVLNPFEILGDQYALEISDQEVETLRLDDEQDLLVVLVTVIPEDMSKMTANMAAPVLINVKRGIGKQVFIDNRECPVRFPIYVPMMAYLKGQIDKQQEGNNDAGSDAQGR